MKKGIERNIFLFYVTRAMSLPFFWLPILYFYLTQIKGFSVVETTFLLGLQEFFLIFLEVPTGVVADRISRKFSIMLGHAITSLPFVLFPFVDGIWVFTILFGIKAVGKALVSGADTALLYDTLVDLGRMSEYKRIKTLAGVWCMGIASVAIFSGGWMGEQQLYNLALWLPLPLQLVGALAAQLMIEPSTSKTAKLIQESNYLSHVTTSIKLVIANKYLVFLAILFAILEGTAVNMKWYYPALFEQLEYGLWLTGIVMTGLYAGKTIINWVGGKLIRDDAYENTLSWTGVIALAWGVIALQMTTITLIPGLILILLGLELSINSSEELIHELLESKSRATSMSFINLLSSVAATILIWSWGAGISFFNIYGSVIGQVLLFGVMYLALRIYRREGTRPARTVLAVSDIS